MSLSLTFSQSCDISAFNTFTLQNLRLFKGYVMLDWLPCPAQYSMNVTVHLAAESITWGQNVLEYIH